MCGAERRLSRNGDPDPTRAGTAGDAALWGGSSAAVGMAANPFGAYQAGRSAAALDLGSVSMLTAPGRLASN